MTSVQFIEIKKQNKVKDKTDIYDSQNIYGRLLWIKIYIQTSLSYSSARFHVWLTLDFYYMYVCVCVCVYIYIYIYTYMRYIYICGSYHRQARNKLSSTAVRR
jgi:hypothetical protein